MKLSEFVIGQDFWSTSGQFKCTDIGTRVVVCIRIDPVVSVSDPSWFEGPPYAVIEFVIDECDLETCFPTLEAVQAAYDFDHPFKKKKE